jgi:hypothetical protein
VSLKPEGAEVAVVPRDEIDEIKSKFHYAGRPLEV